MAAHIFLQLTTVMSGLATFVLSSFFRLSPLHLSFGVSVVGYSLQLSRFQEIVK